ncbi:glycoside hydrolase family 88/105 protein [Pedobacter glucosidilyticus]|uniref:glycoside hydrolase family 88/105 protein n=1 Tax=Pedobacter glucosidilyticus TaxID=1122941 RepID=UPI0004786D86|nr:glycoside hydrolase family 88 protein [Pedobacter glucosidilyticus]
MMKRFIIAFLAGSMGLASCSTTRQISYQQKPLAQELSKTVMHKWSFPIENNSRPLKWTYETGVFLEGITNVWKSTADATYFNYVQRCMDMFVEADGTIKTYKLLDYNIDNIRTGRALLMLYRVTGKEKYYKAAAQLRKQLQEHPRTKEGSYWHKKIYPHQVWLDGLYMGMPFYAEWAQLFNEPEAFNDIANQFIHIEKVARDPKTGLIYHGWDESREQRWSNKETGNSPHFWGRAMGWYGMAMVDVLDHFPVNHPKREEIVAVLNRFAAAIEASQDKKSGLWYQVMNMPDGKGNYLEASASCMFVYTLAKGIRLGVLPTKYEAIAQKAYTGIQKQFLETDAEGFLHLNGTVSVAGLGGKPYRDGSYEYYLSEKVIQDDPKGMGAFILAANEMQTRNNPQVGKGKTVLLDNYFNNEFRKNIIGQQESFHYVWDEMDNNGFSLLGEHITYTGAKLATLKAAPTAANLAQANVYIIVDPDTEKETTNPNFMDASSIQEIKNWVGQGGTLVLMANDEKNAELDKFNKLAEVFGIQYKKELKNPVTGNQYEMGAIPVPAGNEIFKSAKKLYLKEISTLQLQSPAKAVLTHNNDVVMATAKYGKGLVFAVGDPWLYNEYVDGRKLPSDFDNLTAAKELFHWLLKLTSSK